QDLHYDSPDACLNFNDFGFTYVNNYCKFQTEPFQTIDGESSMKCVECTIHNARVTPKADCQKNAICLILKFPDNYVFEEFFTEHRLLLKNLFPKPISGSDIKINVFISEYYITTINNEYTNSKLNIDFPELDLRIYYFSTQSKKSILEVDNTPFSIKFRRLTITVNCTMGTGLVNYVIHGHSVNARPARKSDCHDVRSKQTIKISTTHTSTTTSSTTTTTTTTATTATTTTTTT
ncbi:unnamed protein product, partial [Rotaria magnacalcarata]